MLPHRSPCCPLLCWMTSSFFLGRSVLVPQPRGPQGPAASLSGGRWVVDRIFEDLPDWICPGGGCSLDCAAVGCFPIKAARICGWHRIFHSLRKQVFSLLVSPLRRLCQREMHPLCMPILGFFAQRINLSSHPLWVQCPRSSSSCSPLGLSFSPFFSMHPSKGFLHCTSDRREGLGVLVGGFGVGSQDMETTLQWLWKGEADGGVDAEFLPCWRNPTPPSHHLLPLPLLSVQSVSGWMSSPPGGHL